MTKPKMNLKDLRAELKKLRGAKIDAVDLWDELDEVVRRLPDSPDRDYWTTHDMDVAAIKVKYKLKRWKPKPVELTIVCPHCGWIEKVLIRKKEEVDQRGENWKCPNQDCRFSEAVFPFGKFRGCTVAEVYKQQPSYLAWFMDGVGADSADIREIKEQIEKLPGMKQHLEKYRSKQLQQQWAGRSRFSPAAVDDLCDKLFNGE